MELPPSADSVPRARRHLRMMLSEADSHADLDAATLLVTEVVTNAVLHARTVLTVTVRAVDGWVRVEVHDGSPLSPRMHAFSATSATGRGLRLLDALASRWGVDHDGGTAGKTVWFEVDETSERSIASPDLPATVDP